MSHQHEETHLYEHECDAPGHAHHHHEDGSCCCEQHAKEFHGIDKPMLVRLIVSAALYASALLLPLSETAEMIVLIASALIAGYDILWSALKNLVHAKVFDEYFLMSFAAVAAFVIGEYEEAAAVFVLYRIGAFCQSYAIRHSRRTIAHLTGEESLDDDKVNNRFIARFAKIYTPVILVLAVLIAVALGASGRFTWREGIYRALTFLVLACPCAIVISVPLAYFAGIGAASKKGIFFHDSVAVDVLAQQEAPLPPPTQKSQNGETAYVYPLSHRTGESSRLVLRETESLPLAQRIARKTRTVALENVWFTIVIKLAVLVLSVLGISALWFAVFADSGVTVLVVLNSLRAFHTGKVE